MVEWAIIRLPASELTTMAAILVSFWTSVANLVSCSVRGQTDIREIYNDTLPLWFDKLDPAKINMGLAYYGRGTKHHTLYAHTISNYRPRLYITEFQLCNFGLRIHWPQSERAVYQLRWRFVAG